MKKYTLLLAIITLFITACNQQDNYVTHEPIAYHVSKKVDQSDDYFGTKVADPYRWLEDDQAEDVKQWVIEQNKVTFNYLNSIPFRSKVKDRLSAIWNYPKFSAPFRKGDHYYFYKNDGLQNQDVLFTMDGLKGEPRLFLDPNKFSDDGTIALSGLSFSKDAAYCAYAVSTGGSDWKEIFVMQVNTQQKMEDHLNWVKFSGISWHGDGFYYSRYDAPVEGEELTSSNEYHKVYYHKLGTLQDDDVLIYEDPTKPHRNFYAQITEDERFLILYSSQSTSGNMLFCKDLQAEVGEFVTIVDNFENDHWVIDNTGDKLLVETNLNADMSKLVLVDPMNPRVDHWKDIIPESENKLYSVSMIGGKLFAKYLIDASHRVHIFDVAGNFEREIKLPALGTTTGFGGEKEDSITFYTFTSFTYPTSIYMYNINDNTSTLFRESGVDFNPDDYETKQVFYTSKDGTKIPMFIVHKKGIELNGENPTLLYGYGGFNINILPNFKISRLILLENGGVYAVANLRGGGEYGEAWHKAGMLLKKQNVFDDFIGAAEYLIKEKYTSPEKLAISGRSNGGLLVGAVMTQRPELFKVALPGVGVMDMLRYHKFTIGWAWADEYGSSDTSLYFDYLYGYSPVHNLKEGVNYPATLVTTADHDDRVVPAHSFKFIATLQEKHVGDNPVLIRIETKAGHGKGKPTSKRIEEAADELTFIFYNMGVTPNY